MSLIQNLMKLLHQIPALFGVRFNWSDATGSRTDAGSSGSVDKGKKKKSSGGMSGRRPEKRERQKSGGRRGADVVMDRE